MDMAQRVPRSRWQAPNLPRRVPPLPRGAGATDGACSRSAGAPWPFRCPRKWWAVARVTHGRWRMGLAWRPRG
eukprot:7366280-Alexandrium_andersonii.AAC.1